MIVDDDLMPPTSRFIRVYGRIGRRRGIADFRRCLGWYSGRGRVSVEVLSAEHDLGGGESENGVGFSFCKARGATRQVVLCTFKSVPEENVKVILDTSRASFTNLKRSIRTKKGIIRTFCGSYAQHYT